MKKEFEKKLQKGEKKGLSIEILKDPEVLSNDDLDIIRGGANVDDCNNFSCGDYNPCKQHDDCFCNHLTLIIPL